MNSDSRRNQLELNQIMDVDEVKEQEVQSHTSDNSDDFEDINDEDPVEDSDDLDEGEEDVYERGEGGDGFGGTGGNSNSNRTDRSTRIERMNDPFQSDGSASQKGSAIITTKSSTSIVHSGTSGGARQARLREGKNHECGACGKKFSRPSQLQTHLFMHSGEKPHQCSMCHKHFNVSSNLKRHIKTHFSTKRKSSRNGSMVFRSFSNGFTIKQSQESSRYDMAEIGAGGALRRHSTTVLQPSDRLRWMNTETLFSGTTAESHQKALLKEKAAQEESAGVGPVSSSSKSTQAPSAASTSRAASSTVPAMILEQTEAVAIAPSLTHTTATSSDVQVLPGKTSASSKITNVVKPKPA
ncbi:hypothetical protein BGZ99_001263 [Dissophora globulifera]|uniref:C2H2-type domain-containing protein n=1 Tax=Dissophora globulifera TaxID=979702 RepID=A0A9P6UKB7_9FUNG|nr:hypothetical protein BGZ99_001263 [Dissophora globulifera]